MVNKIDIPNETLQGMVARYRVLSNEHFVSKHIMREVTIRLDKELKQKLESLLTHPKDTGLLKKSWVLPKLYLNTHTGKVWSVYLNNTATVGQQAKLKEARDNPTHRKKKRVGRHNLKRYMSYVDKRTEFYSKQLKVIRNKINPIYKQVIYEQLYHLYQLRPELATEKEMSSVMEAHW